MSSESDSGGGFLWFLDIIFSIINRRNIKKYNKLARGVQRQTVVSAEMVFPPDSIGESIIISGGSQSERLKFCKQILVNAYGANHPIIIIHTSDGELENIVASNNLGTVINNRNRTFAPFASFEFNEIAQIVTETCKAKYDIKPTARYVLQVVYELLLNYGREADFWGFARCPFFQLKDKINKRVGNGALSQDNGDRLDSLLRTGQDERAKIETFFNDMASQISYMSDQSIGGTEPAGILSAIKNNKILCLDIRSSSNVLLMELIVNSLIIAMNRGLHFSLLIDDIAFTNNELLKNAICQKSNHANIIVTKDLFSLTGGKEDTFSAIIGESDKTVLYTHSSHISCEKWSEYLGEYDKIDVTYNSNSGWNEGSHGGYSSSDGQTETVKREQKVKPEQIARLSQNEFFFFDKNSGYIVQTAVE